MSAISSPASSACFICLNEDAPQSRVTRNSKKDNWLECDSCKKWFHAECGGYTTVDCKKFFSRNWLKCVVCCLKNIHISSTKGNTDLSTLVNDVVNKRVTVSQRISASSNSVGKSLSGSRYTASKSITSAANTLAACNNVLTYESCDTKEVDASYDKPDFGTLSDSLVLDSEKTDEIPVQSTDTNCKDNILIIDNIINPAEFSSSKRILHEVNCFCPDVKVEFAYSLAKGGVAIHTADKSTRDELLSKLPQESFGGGVKHLPKDRSFETYFIKGVCTSVSTQEFTNVLKRYGIDTVEARRLANRHTGKPLRVIKVKCSQQTNSRLLSCQIVVNNSKCVVEKQRPVRVIRCYNCQSFGHLARFCVNKTRCEFCSGLHVHEQCLNEACCANCGGSHSASSLQCTVYIAHHETLTKQHTKH